MAPGPQGAAEGALPDIRVIDLSWNWAGPFATMFLADLGAEIIKIESVQRPDGWRSYRFDPKPTEAPYNKSEVFNSVNRNKYGITLDLTSSAGQDLFKRLVAIGDVVIENFTPRVLENWGLPYAVLRQINPGIVLCSMPGYGLTGPQRDHVAYGTPIEEMAGITYLTGYPDAAPQIQPMPYGDPIAGLYAVFSVLAALRQRDSTGRGQHIDLAQREAATSFVGEKIIETQLTGRPPRRLGNRHESQAPQGCYPCRGQDKWTVISVGTEEEWQALCRSLDHPEWAQDPRFADQESRQRHHDELDLLIAAWTQERDGYDIMRQLQAAGVAAAPVLSSPEALSEPQLNARGFWVDVPHDLVGTHRYPGLPMRFSATPGSVRWGSPTLGQHNRQVLTELLGVSPEQLPALQATDVIGTVPLNFRSG